MNTFEKQKKIAVFKLLGLFFVVSILLMQPSGIFAQSNKVSSNEMNRTVKSEMKWFTDARFGMFIHWSPLGAIDQEIGWTWGNAVPKEKYIKMCMDFNPTNFDANAWVTIAKNAGMKYIVFVPKHHSGFSFWDTKATDFNIMNTPYGKDVCKQLSEACEKQGIVFCTYYSIADLHENGWSRMCGVEDKTFEPVKGGMDSYFEFVKKQCAELVQKYHTKNFWFDGFWHSEWYSNPKYRTELSAYLKTLDANLIISRLQMPSTPKGGAWDDGWDFDNNVGDYHSREDHGDLGWEKLYYKGPWEYCSSVAYPNYSYNSKMKYKTSKELIQTLVKIAGRNGNYLLDMAPRPDGSVDDVQQRLFKEMGEWINVNGDCIYGTEGGPYLPIKGDFVSTRKQNKIYLHLLSGQTSITLPAFDAKILSAKIFQSNEKVTFKKEKERLVFFVPDSYKNEKDVILELTIKGAAAKLPLINPLEEIKYTDLFNTSMNKAVACYRIPAIVTAPNGDLVAAIDERVPNGHDLNTNKDINIVIRRSSDNGKTWSSIKKAADFPYGKSASDPSMIVDKVTKEIFLFYNFMDLENENGVYYFHVIKSADNGKTWSKPVDITSQITKPEWHKDFKFITSGNGIQTQSGELLHCLVNLNNGLHIFGSKDHGKSWFFINTPITPADESKIVELSDGRWMINSRVNGPGIRYVHISSDNGKTWQTRPDSTLIDPGCNGSILRYDLKNKKGKKSCLIFANAKMKKERSNMTVRVSYDDGETWSKGKTIYSGSAAYSSLTILKNGEIGLFFEKEDYTQNVFVHFPLSSLLQ
ncbi:MAG: alpha-L-fucosidase [Bacteroidaceae bacterium]